ncbi:MAG: hypothetical protein IIY60_05060 [Clostridia bacterium]|nr:hypothetical protein [Clostridia bacterium]
MEKERKDPKEKKCAICGKDIYAGEEWAYKIRPQKGKTLFFCKYSHKRQYEKEHPEKKVDVIAQAAAEEEKKPKKVPTERGCIARSLIDVIRHGGNQIEFMREQGYKNPYEAYSSVRHYCETNEPHLAEVLKPLKDLPKGPQKKTGRPRKYPAKVEKVDQVPEVEPVQCIAHVAPADIEEAEQAVADLILQGGVNYQLKIDEERKPEIDPKEAMTGLSKALSDFENHVFTKEKVLRIVDEAALECLEDREYRWGSDTLEQSMFRDAKMNAEAIGMMRLRKAIRKKLGVDKE